MRQSIGLNDWVVVTDSERIAHNRRGIVISEFKGCGTTRYLVRFPNGHEDTFFGSGLRRIRLSEIIESTNRFVEGG